VAATSSIWNIGFDGGTALGSVLVGVLATAWGFPPALAVAAGGCVLALGAAYRPGRRRRRAEPTYRGGS
jgi:predicted MFS family arabinose efflux permease